ncbi:MAG: molybdenum cofactor guanylyltransferase [Pyrobaculum sp.]
MAFLVILAGGFSRRFGQDKCTYVWRGRRFIDYVINAARGVADRIYVAAGRNAHLYKGVEVLEDSGRFSGPLAAVDAAVRTVGGEIVFAPCDVPYVKPQVFEVLASTGGTAVWVYPNGRVESMLFKIDSRGALEALDLLARYGRRRVDDLFRLGPTTFLSTARHGVDPRWLFNVNRLEDLGAVPSLKFEVFREDLWIEWGEPPLARWLVENDVGALRGELLRYLEAGLFSMAAHVAKDLSKAWGNYGVLAELLYGAVDIEK